MKLIVALLVAAPQLIYAQYFQGLYDADSSYDWGRGIILLPDGSYFVEGDAQNGTNASEWTFDMQISADGNTILNKHFFRINNTDIYPGLSGDIKSCGSGFLSSHNVYVRHSPHPYCSAALIKYKATGDTAFFRTYTDTSRFYQFLLTCAVMPYSGYIGGGGQNSETPSFSPTSSAYLVRTDSMGDTLWTHTYKRIDTQSACIMNVIPLADGRIVLGAQSTFNAFTPQPADEEYFHNTPWFIVVDSMGNVLKDTLWGDPYMVGAGNICNNLYADKNGGYIHIGVRNQLFTIWATDAQNFPAYIAHLDTNFRITWITNFPYNSTDGHQQAYTMRQLRDSSYMIMGEDDFNHGSPTTQGFAAHIGRDGMVIWHNHYISDTHNFAYLTDMVEKPDCNLLFVGKTFNDTCAGWKGNGDVWLLGLDSNGCENPFCAPTAVRPPPGIAGAQVKIYPNPTSGNFTMEIAELSGTSATGQLYVSNQTGQQIAQYTVKGGTNELQLPAGLSNGLYMCRYIPAGSNDYPVVVPLLFRR